MLTSFGCNIFLFTIVILLAFIPSSQAMIRNCLRKPLTRIVSHKTTLFSSLNDVNTHTNKKLSIFGPEADTKYFEFNRLEKDIYKFWEESEYFKPKPSVKNRKPFVIPMPPPNVTGYLHMGHALFVALQDIMARYNRMRGSSTLWLPGTDHAGIATQLLVERSLNEQGIKRQEIGREKFLEKVWAWKNEKGDYITKQMRRLGASADWSRQKFTLDDDMSSAVVEAFVRLHEKGLIYKGDYLVNWSPNLQTAVSDLEVEYSEEEGKLYYFKYMLADGSSDFIPVSTTRPETILGDAAVCVHPNDERYKSMVGKMVKVPMTDRIIPVIADEYVDMAFGTGALKITPAHDPNDYEIGKKFNLPLINIMNKDASINEIGGPYAGLDRFDCRNKLWDDMTESGLVIKVTPHVQRVPRSQRGGEIIEPLVSGQWFVKMDDMARRACDVVRTKQLTIVPERFEKIWFNWLENIHDWCVSRQLWWGHRIPAYYVDGSKSEYIVARNIAEAQEKAKAKYNREVLLTQDDDVLDTWFSSGLWPFATVGWPHADKSDPLSDYNKFYPSSVLETGYDILFFWVARMVMMGLEFTNESPFHTIYLHGLVRDGEGRKMSKTTGNVIDPLVAIDSFGCDTLRYSLVSGCQEGQDVLLSMERMENNRNFANKLWNVGKYIQNVLSQVERDQVASLTSTSVMMLGEIQSLPLAERFIVSACHTMIEDVTRALEAFSFSEALRLIYEFIWDEFADWYVEASKTRMRDANEAVKARRVLVYVWDACLKALHPFMPYITEVLYQQIPHQHDSIMISDWPKEDSSLAIDEEAMTSFYSFQALVRSIRYARAEYNTEPGKKLAATVVISSFVDGDKGSKLFSNLGTERAALALLGRLEESALKIELASNVDVASFSNSIHLVVEDGLEAYIPVSDMIDTEKEKARLLKQLEKIKKEVDGLESRLNNPQFMEKAPANVKEEVLMAMKEKTEQMNSITKSIEELSK